MITLRQIKHFLSVHILIINECTRAYNERFASNYTVFMCTNTIINDCKCAYNDKFAPNRALFERTNTRINERTHT